MLEYAVLVCNGFDLVCSSMISIFKTLFGWKLKLTSG